MSKEKHIIRAYDIRGIFPEEINENIASWLGKVLSFYLLSLKNKKSLVFIARDNRESSTILTEALKKNLKYFDVIDISFAPTPILYYYSRPQLNINILGIIVTASHNPANYNGFKIVCNGKIIDGVKMREIIEKFDENNKNVHKKATLNYDDRIVYNMSNICSEKYFDSYINYLCKKIGINNNVYEKNIKILWDCNDGVVGYVIEKIAGNINKKLNFCLENDYINTSKIIKGQPDPTTKENIDRLKKKVIELSYDIAFGFDGDGDRLIMILKNGIVLQGDKIIFLIANYLSEQNIKKVVVDVKISPVIIKLLQQMNIEVIISKTGHSFIKNTMRANNAEIAGEMSGHIFFNLENNYAYDDPLLACAMLIDMYVSRHDSFLQIIKSIPLVFGIYDLRIPCDKGAQHHIMMEIKNTLVSRNIVFDETDGVRIIDENGWWLIRQSNTEDMLVICLEGDTEVEYVKIKFFICDLFCSIGCEFLSKMVAERALM